MVDKTAFFKNFTEGASVYGNDQIKIVELNSKSSDMPGGRQHILNNLFICNTTNDCYQLNRPGEVTRLYGEYIPWAAPCSVRTPNGGLCYDRSSEKIPSLEYGKYIADPLIPDQGHVLMSLDPKNQEMALYCMDISSQKYLGMKKLDPEASKAFLDSAHFYTKPIDYKRNFSVKLPDGNLLMIMSPILKTHHEYNIYADVKAFMGPSLSQMVEIPILQIDERRGLISFELGELQGVHFLSAYGALKWIPANDSKTTIVTVTPYFDENPIRLEDTATNYHFICHPK